jgi:hypothetical protein
MRKTVKQLDEELQAFKGVAGNVQLQAGTCWNEEQLGAILEVYNRYGELVKLEVTSTHSPDKTAYHYQLWHYPLLNSEFKDRHTPTKIIQGLGYLA